MVIDIVGLLNKYKIPLLLFIACFLLFNVNGKTLGSGDTIPAAVLPFNILENHNLLFDKFAVEYGNVAPYLDYPADIPYCFSYGDGHYFSIFPITTPVLVTPLYLLPYIALKILGIPISLYNPVFYATVIVMEKVAASIVASLAVVFVYLSLRKLFDQKVALIVSLIFAFGTDTWAISSQGLWQQGMVELLIAVMIFVVLRDVKKPGRLNPVILGLCSGLLAFCRPSDAVFILPVAAYAMLLREKKALWQYPLSALIAALPFLAYNYYYFHNILGWYQQWYSSDPSTVNGLGLNLLGVFAALLASPSRGIFAMSPVLILALPGLAMVYYRCSNRTLKYFFLLLSVAGLINVIVYMLFFKWWGGWNFGYRYLTGGLPVYCLFLGVCFDRLFRMKRPGLKIALCLGVLLLLAASLFVQIVGAFYYPNGNWEGSPTNIDLDPMRSWNITDNQVLRSYNAGPLIPTQSQLSYLLDAYKMRDIIIVSGYGIENWNGIPTQWVTDNVTLIVHEPADKNVTLTFNAASFYTPRTLRIYVNDVLACERVIPLDFVDVKIPLQLGKGDNRVRFYCVEGSQHPSDIPALKSQDTRALSFVFQNFTML